MKSSDYAVSTFPASLSADETFISIEQLQHLVHLLDQSDVSELEVRCTEINAHLLLRKARAREEAATVMDALPPVVEEETPSPAIAQHLVRAQCVGIFYLWSRAREPLQIAVGDHVKEGQHIGIVQSLDILNEVEATVAGHIVEILVEDGQPVEFGRPLFRIDAAQKPL